MFVCVYACAVDHTKPHLLGDTNTHLTLYDVHHEGGHWGRVVCTCVCVRVCLRVSWECQSAGHFQGPYCKGHSQGQHQGAVSEGSLRGSARGWYAAI